MTIKERILMLAPVVLALPLCELADAVVRVLPQPRRSLPKGKRRLLIIRLDAIGDFILFLDTFKEYRRLFPADQWEITLLGNTVWSPLAAPLPYADRYVFTDSRKIIKNPLYRLRLFSTIRNYRFDCVIEPTYSRSALAGDSIVRTSGAEMRIGSTGNLSNMTAWQKRRADRWYTRLIPASSTPLNELERNAEFLRGLGIRDFRASSPRYPHNPISDRDGAAEFGLVKSFFILFPGASVRGRQWPADRFAEIARRVFRKTEWTPVICGGPQDVPVSRQVSEYAPELPWINCTGRTTLPQMMNMLAVARMLVANETGVVHMATAVDCPTVCIIGGGHFGRFYSSASARSRIAYKSMDCFGCDWWCRYTTVRCIMDIETDSVWKEVNSVIEAIA